MIGGGFLKKGLLACAVFLSMNSFVEASLKEINNLKSPFTLKPLPYAVKSLEPTIDAKTMEIHHGKHHQAYIDNLNKALGSRTAVLTDLLASISKETAAVRNNAGGHWNHSFFWSILSGKKDDHIMSKRLEDEIKKYFGTIERFKSEFEKAGNERFGSGWVWLIRDRNHNLKITSTPNQDNTLMDVNQVRGLPILGVDVWEHAYYLKYYNKRAEFLKNFWSIVNWKEVDALDKEIMGQKAS